MSSWFLRGGETGLHTFSWVEYDNKGRPSVRNLQEFRTLFRLRRTGEGAAYTQLSTNADTRWPLPDLTGSMTWQDALSGSQTKVNHMCKILGITSPSILSNNYWRDHDVHGVFAYGSKGRDFWGSWLVSNTRDTFRWTSLFRPGG